MRRYPEWLKKPFSPDATAREVRTLVDDLSLTTVCESAVCPNLRECFSQRQLTFMILGERCTRRCGFCAVDSGRPQPIEPDEPARVAEAVRRLGLRHVVITSVARDDLKDEGADHFVDVIEAVRVRNPEITVEVLVPDFHARRDLVEKVVVQAHPEVFAHNVETVQRLSPLVRPQADYHRTLQVLRMSSEMNTQTIIKSGIMLGLGETENELVETFKDLSTSGVTHLTIGQYLRPSAEHLPVMDYISPQRFSHFESLAYDNGFRWVKSGPFVRSSYHAIDAIDQMATQNTNDQIPITK